MIFKSFTLSMISFKIKLCSRCSSDDDGVVGIAVTTTKLRRKSVKVFMVEVPPVNVKVSELQCLQCYTSGSCPSVFL